MLKIQFRDGRSGPVPLTEPGQTIGRGAANDIVINEEGVNSFHADLKVDGTMVTLTDVANKGATSLNGQVLSAPTIIRAGDVITICGVELEVTESDQSSGEDSKTLVLSGTALFDLGVGSWAIVADTGPEKGQVIAINEKTRIGRALDCDISILEPALSRNHAELDIVDEQLVITDLNSSNGTYLNGKRIKNSVCRDGDVLQFERVKFIIQAPD